MHSHTRVIEVLWLGQHCTNQVRGEIDRLIKCLSLILNPGKDFNFIWFALIWWNFGGGCTGGVVHAEDPEQESPGDPGLFGLHVLLMSTWFVSGQTCGDRQIGWEEKREWDCLSLTVQDILPLTHTTLRMFANGCVRPEAGRRVSLVKWWRREKYTEHNRRDHSESRLSL